jgi:hypothetical protein
MNAEPRAIDLHRLDLRFADLRLADPAAVERLCRSIERSGQLVPCVAIGEADRDRVVLLDGYRRVAALRRVGADCALVDCWRCDVADGLIGIFGRAQARALAGIEEALVLRELTQGQRLSQHEVARRLGRDVSWVSRRLQLLCALPDPVLLAVRAGRLSAWSAVRVLVPLARANSEHGERFMAALAATPLSTREQRSWFEHYRQASRDVRERMVDRPRLFLDALQAQADEQAGQQLRAGPEGACAEDLRILETVLARLIRRLGRLRPVPDFVPAAYGRLELAMSGLGRLLADRVEEA